MCVKSIAVLRRKDTLTLSKRTRGTTSVFFFFTSMTHFLSISWVPPIEYVFESLSVAVDGIICSQTGEIMLNLSPKVLATSYP